MGSYLFGIGIVLAGGCATGTWYRAGEGLLGSWVALFFYMISAAAMKSGFLVPLNLSLIHILGKPIEETKIITAHVGNGVSITAVDGGKSVDTSMAVSYTHL